MTEHIRDFIHFLGIEEENRIKSCVNLGEYFPLIHNLDILYRKVLEIGVDKREHKIPAFLFLNVHRELYLSMTNFIRLHQSKSFCNLRSAIDSAFTAYYLLKNPDKGIVYLAKIQPNSEKEREWNKIFKNIKVTINNNIDDYPHAKGLVETHDFCSAFAHADAFNILTRYIEDKKNLFLGANYFDYEKAEDDYKKWLIYILSSFFKIFSLFWDVFFKERASEEISKVVNQSVIRYKNKLEEFGEKFPLKI